MDDINIGIAVQLAAPERVPFRPVSRDPAFPVSLAPGGTVYFLGTAVLLGNDWLSVGVAASSPSGHLAPTTAPVRVLDLGEFAGQSLARLRFLLAAVLGVLAEVLVVRRASRAHGRPWQWAPLSIGVGASLALLVGLPVAFAPYFKSGFWTFMVFSACWGAAWALLGGSLRPAGSFLRGLLMGFLVYTIPGVATVAWLFPLSPAIPSRPLESILEALLVVVGWPGHFLFMSGLLGAGPN